MNQHELIYNMVRMAKLIEAGNEPTVYGGLHVEYDMFERPVPMFLTGWNDAYWMTETALLSLKMNLRVESVKRTELTTGGFLRWPERKLYTRDLFLSALYRDSDDGETIRLALKFSPPVAARLKSPGVVYDVLIQNAVKSWFPFKAAYQECGFFLWAGGTLTPDPNSLASGWGDWLIHKALPMYVLQDIDFSEIGEWEKIHASTQDARFRLYTTARFAPE